MARRELQEINAGSMADIAFLLLIFWLVTTTIDSDEGIKRQLPPPLPPDAEKPPVNEKNVFVVEVVAGQGLIVEDEQLSLRFLKDRAKDFLISTGDGLISHPVGSRIVGPTRPESPDQAYPPRVPVLKSEVMARIAEAEQRVATADSDKKKSNALKILENWREKLVTIDLLGGSYNEMASSALISLSHDKASTYDAYIQVQNELQSAVNELRDELAMSKFGVTYVELEAAYDRNKDDIATLQKINAVRAVYPQRISEAEPTDFSSKYN